MERIEPLCNEYTGTGISVPQLEPVYDRSSTGAYGVRETRTMLPRLENTIVCAVKNARGWCMME